MWFHTASLFLVLPLVALSAPVTTEDSQRIDYDAIIVGGGPAGLSALSGLARVRRNVLLIDSGHYRNGPTRHMHDVIGNDGLDPAYYRWLARKKISLYSTVTMTNGSVTKIQPENNNAYFSVSGTYENNSQITYTTRKVVLATGIRDILPDTPGLQENWGRGIFWCPWCDGHEHAGQQMGIIGPLAKVPGIVSEILTLNKDIKAFTNGTASNDTSRAVLDEKSPEWQAFLKAKNVPVDDRTIARIERLRDGNNPSADPALPSYPEHDLFRLHFTEGEPVIRNAFITSFGTGQASSLPKDLGLEMDGTSIAVSENKGLLTSMPSVYAAGDVNGGATNVPYALFSGKRVAVYLHIQLEREDTARLLASLNGTDSNPGNHSKRSMLQKARAIWDEVNGEPDDPLYAGKFDQ